MMKQPRLAMDRPLRSPRGPLLPPPKRNRSESCDASSASSSTACPTSAVTFMSSNHGRLRRKQRGIRIRQLKAAIKHGHRQPSGVHGRSKYTHNGITFVVDDATKREVTSYATPLDLPYKTIPRDALDRHMKAIQKIRTDPSYCKSHSVLLVDVSGSMRNSDVQGSRTRLAAVWLALAEDYVRNRIESGVAGDQDAITVVLMGEGATVHPKLCDMPTDWIAYNSILKIYKEGAVGAFGHGCYRPSLAVAEKILTRYDSASCALALCILSDGRPSDSRICRQSWDDATNSISACIESLASKLGRRLTVQTVGIGSGSDQFKTLRTLSDAASSFGSVSAFQLPSMTSSSLGAAMSSIATSMTETQTELLDRNGSQRRVRPVMREDRRRLPELTEVVDREEFNIYMEEDVERFKFDPAGQGEFSECSLVHPEARGVAIKKKVFGEGTERFAYQFFEVAEDGLTVVGEPLVAKESRYVEESNYNREDMEKFVKRFCRIQYQASKAAQAFNSKLDSIVTLDPDTARVSFLPCSVYYLNDKEKGKHAVIVERRLFGKFEKWNTNNGWKKTRKSPRKQRDSAPLAAIPEEITSTENSIEVIDVDADNLFVTQDEVAQAFSHYSYIFGGRKMLICDLQGVYDRPKRTLRFTDPVVHYHNVSREDRQGRYGKTDRGDKGICDFLHSHECNGLCDIVTKGFLTARDTGKRQKIE